MVRCETIPDVDFRFRMRIEGRDVAVWCFDPAAPRPCFFPLLGPSGVSLTRMGHPGAPDHDHHRSVWFAHEKVMGVNFWADGTGATIRQVGWKLIEDGEERTAFAVELHWIDGHDPTPLLVQQLIAVLSSDGAGGFELELQSDWAPGGGQIELLQSSFGVLAVRVAKSISAVFGGGQLSCSEGRIGEPAIFGQTARWIDYSGPIQVWREGKRDSVSEGITYFDHPENPSFPTRWHVRDDGWMGASLCRERGLVISSEQPLRTRYLLAAHAGAYDAERAEATYQRFAAAAAWSVVPSSRPHERFELQRE